LEPEPEPAHCGGGGSRVSINFEIDTRSDGVSTYGYRIAGQTVFRRPDGSMTRTIPTPEIVVQLQQRIPARRVLAGLRRMLAVLGVNSPPETR